MHTVVWSWQNITLKMFGFSNITHTWKMWWHSNILTVVCCWQNITLKMFGLSNITHKKKPFSGLELATNRIFRTGCVDTPTLKILAFQISHIKKNKPFSGLELVTNQIFRTGCVDTPTTPPPPLIATIIIYLRSNTNPNPPWTQP
jgi:hypothetical protein